MKDIQVKMCRLWRSLMVVGVVISVVVEAEIYKSVQHITQVFAAERRLMDALSLYVYKTEANLSVMKRYLKNYEQVKEESRVANAFALASKDAKDVSEERLAGNPIHAYQLMKRLVFDWKDIQSLDPQQDWGGVEEILSGEGNALGFPDDKDLRGAAEAIIRLHNDYLLNATDLVRGVIAGTQTFAGLDAEDCLYLAKHAKKLGMNFNAIQWYEQAFTLARSKISHQVSSHTVGIPKAKETSQETPSNNDTEIPYNEKVHKIQQARKKQYEMAKMKFKLGSELTFEDDIANFQALCRGEQFLSNAYLSKLKCYFDDRNSSYLTLMPAKVEEHHIDPQVLVFHDFISDADAERLKDYASKYLSTATVRKGDSKYIVSNMRTSKVTWMDDIKEERKYLHVTRRIEALTGLSVLANGSSEKLQVTNYGTGGHFLIHKDYLFFDEERYEMNSMNVEEDRIATFMVYLSDVTKGGATVFPKLGVSVLPQKRSALFWYNLKKNGDSEVKSTHGGCPVLYGSKWVCNKWVRMKNQFQKRPCSLDENE